LLAGGLQAFARVLSSFIESFGWPGTFVLLAVHFTNQWATKEQKERIIETYVLGTNVFQAWPIILMAVVFVATVLAQRKWYTKKLGKVEKELARIGAEKSALQESLLGKRLKHAHEITERKERGE